MHRYTNRRALVTIALASILWLASITTLADSPVVRAVLFYSPSCGHCHKVITEDLPPLFEKYGDRLQIIGIDASNPDGGELYTKAADQFGIPPEQQGVPMLVISDIVLVGSLQIPQELPGLIERYLADGGVDWPSIPGLDEILAAAEATPTATMAPPNVTADSGTPAAETVFENASPVPSNTPAQVALAPAAPGAAGAIPAVARDDVLSRLARDPVGNGLAIVLLVGMVAVVVRTAVLFQQRAPEQQPAWRRWAIPILAFVGLWVAVYLAYVETTQTRAICGPVGDCNTVQQSAYARLFGMVPIGVVGVAGYLAILASWIIAALSGGRVQRYARLALFALTAGGVLFSIYLTFLEPFVIGATCAWCLSSAAIMTLLLLIAAEGVRWTRDAQRANGATT